jgi:hypothetical protein
MAPQVDKLAVFVAGGPAAGINGVIKGVVQEADNLGLRVLGYVDGARGLVEGHCVYLSRQMVEDIHTQGGSVLGTSRYRMDDAGMDRAVANLRREGVDGLISIGGEGTLKLANALRQRGFPIVHVPKTIDNDIAGVAQSFGFDTAVQLGQARGGIAAFVHYFHPALRSFDHGLNAARGSFEDDGDLVVLRVKRIDRARGAKLSAERFDDGEFVRFLEKRGRDHAFNLAYMRLGQAEPFLVVQHQASDREEENAKQSQHREVNVERARPFFQQPLAMFGRAHSMDFGP